MSGASANSCVIRSPRLCGFHQRDEGDQRSNLSPCLLSASDPEFAYARGFYVWSPDSGVLPGDSSHKICYNLIMPVKPIHAKERMLLFSLTSLSFFRAARNEDADTKDHTSTPVATSRGTHYTQVVAARSCWSHRHVVYQYQPLGTRYHQAQSLLSPQALRPLREE